MKRAWYLLVIPIGLLATGLILLASMLLKPLGLHHLYAMIHDRGPAPYLTIWSGATVLLASAWALLHRDYNRRLATLLAILSFLPLFWGVAATCLGLTAVPAGYWAMRSADRGRTYCVRGHEGWGHWHRHRHLSHRGHHRYILGHHYPRGHRLCPIDSCWNGIVDCGWEPTSFQPSNAGYWRSASA